MDARVAVYGVCAGGAAFASCAGGPDDPVYVAGFVDYLPGVVGIFDVFDTGDEGVYFSRLVFAEGEDGGGLVWVADY